MLAALLMIAECSVISQLTIFWLMISTFTRVIQDLNTRLASDAQKIIVLMFRRMQSDWASEISAGTARGFAATVGDHSELMSRVPVKTGQLPVT